MKDSLAEAFAAEVDGPRMGSVTSSGARRSVVSAEESEKGRCICIQKTGSHALVMPDEIWHCGSKSATMAAVALCPQHLIEVALDSGGWLAEHFTDEALQASSIRTLW